jgi:site-specific DNA recombinase
MLTSEILLVYGRYSRKSSDEKKKQVLSIPAQNSELLRISTANGLTVKAIFEETQTAFVPGRPAFRRMIEGIKAGEYNAILCWKLDRLARNIAEAAEIATLLTGGQIKEIRTYERVYLPTDSLVMIMLEFTMATQYSRDLSTGVKRGQKEKLNTGGWPGFAPTGYVNDREKKTVNVDHIKAPFVQKAYALYASGGYSLSTIQRELNKAIKAAGYGFSFRRTTIERILTNTFYYGMMSYAGELYEGDYQPLITKELHEKVQKVMHNKSKRTGYRYKPFDYRGLFRCGTCACTVTLDIQKGIRYWRCTKKRGPCSEHYLQEAKAFHQLDTFFKTFDVDERIPDMLLEIHHEDRAKEMDKTNDQLRAIETRLGEKRAFKKRLNNLFAMGTFAEDEYKEAKNDIVQELFSLNKEIEKIQRGHLTRLEPERLWLLRLKEAISTEKEPRHSERADFLRIIGSNQILRTGEVTISAESRWKIWADWKSRFAKDFSKMPVGYQLAQLRQLLTSVRTAHGPVLVGDPERAVFEAGMD